jgi:hypothetical protein
LEGTSVKVNELLYWLSARVQGSWEQFKSAVEALHLPDDEPAADELPEEDFRQGGMPLHQELRLMLERLGHAEFFAGGCEGGWRIAPPVWGASGVKGPLTAVLCGARTLPLLERVRAVSTDVARLVIDEGPTFPTVYRLTADDADQLSDSAASTGIAIQFDTPRAILCATPAGIQDSHEVADLPLGRDWIVQQFDAESLRWNSSSREGACRARDGLFRFRLPYLRRHFLRRRRRTYEMDGATAKYAMLRRHRRAVFRYNPSTSLCTVPATCRPPTLVERALILCSGHLPAFEPSDSTLTYSHVSADIAHLAARLLDPEIVHE